MSALGQQQCVPVTIERGPNQHDDQYLFVCSVIPLFADSLPHKSAYWDWHITQAERNIDVQWITKEAKLPTRVIWDLGIWDYYTVQASTTLQDSTTVFSREVSRYGPTYQVLIGACCGGPDLDTIPISAEEAEAERKRASPFRLANELDSLEIYEVNFPLNDSKRSEVQILDLSGKIVLEQDMVSENPQLFDLTHLPKGRYVVYLKSDNWLMTQILNLEHHVEDLVYELNELDPISKKRLCTFTTNIYQPPPYRVSIVNLKGNEVLSTSGQTRKIEVDVATLPSGLYLVNFESQGKLNSTRFIIPK